MSKPRELDELGNALAMRTRRVLVSAPGRREAAVLVPFVSMPDGLHVLFTLRTDSVPTHKGQVAFPGGGVDDMDTSPVETALREAEEELGIRRDDVEIIGLADDAFSISAQRVTPVVGWLPRLPALKPEPREIADVFTVPLGQLVPPESIYDEVWPDQHGRARRVPFFKGGKHTIWGLTAWMLKEILTVMDGVPRGDSYHEP